MKIYPFQAIYPNVDLIASSDSFFGSVREDYNEYYDNGFFHHSGESAHYIMEIRTGTKVHTGMITCIHIEDYIKGKIVKHEETIPSSEQSMLRLLLHRGAMVKPVLLCHPELKDLTREIKKQKKKRKPFLSFTIASGPQHYTLYQVPEKDAADLARLYKSLVPKLYIADGHHRCSTAEKLFRLQGDKHDHDYSMVLAALFPFDQLDILDYNRVVQLPYHLPLTRFMASLSRCCDIQLLNKPSKPKRKHDLTMCLQSDWYQLSWKLEILKKYKKTPAVLDAYMLDKEIIEGILGIAELSTETKVDYIAGNYGPEKVEEKARQSDHHVGFCIFPVTFDELVKVSDTGGRLPPKSTWFEPRMINGLVVKSY